MEIPGKNMIRFIIMSLDKTKVIAKKNKQHLSELCLRFIQKEQGHRETYRSQFGSQR